jgi:signal transduction histidine kinase
MAAATERRPAGGPSPWRGGRLWALVFALPVVGLLLAGLWSLAATRQQFEDKVLRSLRLLDGHTLHTLEALEVMLAAVNARVGGLGWDEIRTRPDLHAFLSELVAASGSVASLGLTGPDGHIALASETERPPTWVNLSDRDFVAAFPAGTSRRESFVAAPVISRVDGRALVHLSRPRIGPEGRADGGTVVTGFSPAVFERAFAAVAMGEQIDLALVREDGVVLARYPDGIVNGGGGGAARLLPGDPAAPMLSDLRHLVVDEPRFAKSAGLLAGPRLTAAVRVGNWPLLLVEQGAALDFWVSWARMMAFPALGAAAATALLALLMLRERREAAAEQRRLRELAEAAEAAHQAALERAALESRLRQVEKTATLGQLAAGVAHDFNNTLQAVMIGATALQRHAGEASEVGGAARMILRAAERGTELTRRMLNFARRDEEASLFPVGDALREAADLLTRSLGLRHRLRLVLPGAGLPVMRGAKAEFEAVLINLVLNARDAMQEGGEIVVSAVPAQAPPALRAAAEEGAAASKLGDGRWLCLRVTDTGAGMDAETLTRAGEAFFTTKPRGKGTGLGLSMARGFAERTGGTLELRSAPGEGTVATLWLPVV